MDVDYISKSDDEISSHADSHFYDEEAKGRDYIEIFGDSDINS